MFAGLDLQVYIDDDEYVPGLKHERGLRMDVHAFDTIENVAENGISVPPGKLTYIGMTLVSFFFSLSLFWHIYVSIKDTTFILTYTSIHRCKIR